MISISTYNSIQQAFIRQEKVSSNQKTSHSLESGQKYFSLPRKGKRHLKLKERFIQYLIDNSIKYAVVFGNQEKIADYLDCDVRHLRRIIKDLQQSGWIKVITTPGLCNIYILNPIFEDKTFCIGMNYIFNNLLVDKEIYRAMYVSKHIHEQSHKPDIKSYQFQETVYDDERFRPVKTDYKILDEIFGSSKMSSIYKDEYTHNKESNFLVAVNNKIGSSDCILEKNNKENHKIAGQVVFFSLNSLLSFPKKTVFKKSSSNTAEHKKGTGMEDNLYEQIIPVAAHLKSIRPTKWGQIKLSAFTDEAILYADSRMLKTATAVSDKFKYFVKICKLHSEQQQLPISWSTMIDLGAQYKMQDSHIWLDESFVPEKVVTKQLKKSNSSVNHKEHNDAIVAHYAPHLLENKKQKQSIEEELEELKINDPKRYEWRKKYAEDLLVACGRDPKTGEPLPTFNQQQAATVLSKTLGISVEPEKKSPIDYLKEQKELAIANMDEYEEAYDLLGVVDPLGDRK